MEPIIKIRNLTKIYSYGGSGKYFTLRDTLSGLLNPRSYLKRPTTRKSKNQFYALRNVNLDIYPGDIVGVVGKNGAGKSTLLKVLSRITPPTAGTVMINGRIGSLLEVGTGFHQELTGRENIFLNGAILGMTKKEIKRKLNAITEFAEIEKFIDTPVKHYSSGMYVRLAFSVAAYLEPEILLVDEVLAVGDAAFQKKCLGKMDNIAKQEGRTILFVSHNMNAINILCNKAILIENGKVVKQGIPELITELHLKNSSSSSPKVKFAPRKELDIQILELSMEDHRGKLTNIFDVDEPWMVSIRYEVRKTLSRAHISVAVNTATGLKLFTASDSDNNPDAFKKRKPGTYLTRFTCQEKLLNVGIYNLTALVTLPRAMTIDSQSISGMTIIQKKSASLQSNDELRGPIIPHGKWETKAFL